MSEGVNNYENYNTWVLDPIERGWNTVNMEWAGFKLFAQQMGIDVNRFHQLFGNDGSEWGVEGAAADIAHQEKIRLAVEAPANRDFLSRNFGGAAEGVLGASPEIAFTVGGAVFGGPAGAAALGGLAGGIKAAGRSVVNSLREEGVDLTQPEAITSFIEENPEKWGQIWNQAGLDSGIGASTWAALGGGGTKAAMMFGNAFTKGSLTAKFATGAQGVGINAGTQLGVNAGNQLYYTGNINAGNLITTTAMASVIPPQLKGIKGGQYINGGAYVGGASREGEWDFTGGWERETTGENGGWISRAGDEDAIRTRQAVEGPGTPAAKGDLGSRIGSDASSYADQSGSIAERFGVVSEIALSPEAIRRAHTREQIRDSYDRQQDPQADVSAGGRFDRAFSQFDKPGAGAPGLGG